MPERPFIARYSSSPMLYGRDSRDSQPNPEFHPTILFDGDEFFLETGDVLTPDDVPPYIRAQADELVQKPAPQSPQAEEVNVKEILENEVPFVDQDQKLHRPSRRK